VRALKYHRRWVSGGNRMSWISRTNRTEKLCLLIITSILFFMVVSSPALAEGNVQIAVSTGIGGEYKSSEWVPIEVTVTNNKEDIEGNLVLELNANQEFTGTYYQPIAVAKGATKKVTLVVPGHGLSSNHYVKLMQNNKEIAKQKIGGRNLGGDTLLVGVLASDPDTANFLATLPKESYRTPVRVMPLKGEDIPAFVTPLKSLDILVINNFSTDQLSEEQIEAIKDWTREGGMLILAGGAHFDKVKGAFSSILPVQVEGIEQIEKFNELEVAVNQSIDTELGLTISRATQLKGKTLYQVDKIPLFVVGDAGVGKVLYCAYDLVEEPLASWKGNGELWAGLLLKTKGVTFIDARMGMDEWWPLNNAVDRIPSLQLPDITTLAIFFAMYVLLIGPVLYFILKRKEKREWIWFTVPLLACTVAVGIYMYGSMERSLNVLVHNVGYVDINNEGYADVKVTSAIFVPRGGDYTMRFKDNTTVLPFNQHYSPYNQQTSETWFSITPDQSEVQFRGVEFWSMRKAAIRQSLEDAGQFTSNLTYQGGKLVGTVTNDTRYTLRDVKVFNGRHVQDIDTLAPGDEAIVEINFDKAIRPGHGTLPTQSLLPNYLQGRNMNNIHSTREASILEVLNMNRHPQNFQQWTNPVSIIGWTEEKIIDQDIVGRDSKTSSLSLIRGTLNVKPSSDGYVFYPAGSFEAIQTESTGQIDHTGDGYMMQRGEITFEFHLNRENTKIEIDKIQMYTWSNDGIPFDKKVYNWESNEYDPYGEVFDNNNLQGEKLGKYISTEGILRIQMGHDLNGYHHLGQPAISVEGKVGK
jgi:hypothetical protein